MDPVKAALSFVLIMLVLGGIDCVCMGVAFLSGYCIDYWWVRLPMGGAVSFLVGLWKALRGRMVGAVHGWLEAPHTCCGCEKFDPKHGCQ